MRQSQKQNRSRGRGNRKGGGGGNNMNRVYDSAGPEGKVRGTPQQIIDKYLALARDAQTSGDRVAGENFLQHAEHYQRILIAATSEQEKARREAQAAANDDSGDETDDTSDDQGGRGGHKANGNGNGRDRSDSRKSDSNAIEGMAMIDGENDSGELVVAPEEIGSQQSRGGGRRPRKRRAEGDGGDQQKAETAEN